MQSIFRSITIPAMLLFIGLAAFGSGSRVSSNAASVTFSKDVAPIFYKNCAYCQKVILSVPRYSFNWQTRYEFKEPVAAPKGSRLECVAHFDNSTKNKWNPDPAKTVRWGPQTWEEIMIGFVGFTVDNQNLQVTPRS